MLQPDSEQRFLQLVLAQRRRQAPMTLPTKDLDTDPRETQTHTPLPQSSAVSVLALVLTCGKQTNKQTRRQKAAVSSLEPPPKQCRAELRPIRGENDVMTSQKSVCSGEKTMVQTSSFVGLGKKRPVVSC